MSENEPSALRILEVAGEVPRGDVCRWINGQPGHPRYRLTPGSKLYAILKDRVPVGAFELTPFPLVQCVFDGQGSALQTFRAFEAMRAGMDTLGMAPYIAVAHDSPLLGFAERVMVGALPDVRLFKFK